RRTKKLTLRCRWRCRSPRETGSAPCRKLSPEYIRRASSPATAADGKQAIRRVLQRATPGLTRAQATALRGHQRPKRKQGRKVDRGGCSWACPVRNAGFTCAAWKRIVRAAGDEIAKSWKLWLVVKPRPEGRNTGSQVEHDA